MDSYAAITSNNKTPHTRAQAFLETMHARGWRIAPGEPIAPPQPQLDLDPPPESDTSTGDVA